jgi:hypothetical protein
MSARSGRQPSNLGGMLAQSVMAQGADVEEAGGTDSSGDKDDKKTNKFKCRVSRGDRVKQKLPEETSCTFLTQQSCSWGPCAWMAKCLVGQAD